MSSLAKARANRRNSLKSTGPKSPAGKTIAARNSLRHGLSLPVLDDPTAAREAEDLARAIETSVTGSKADSPRHAVTIRIAEAELDLRRIRLVKRPVTIEVVSDPAQAAGPLRELARIDRYEGRAVSRRNRMIRVFDRMMEEELRAGALDEMLAKRGIRIVRRTKPTEKTE